MQNIYEFYVKKKKLCIWNDQIFNKMLAWRFIKIN